MLKYLADLLDSKNPQREAKHQLRECELELLQALAAQEHWNAKVTSLKTRKARLHTQVAADAREAEQNAREGMSSYS